MKIIFRFILLLFESKMNNKETAESCQQFGTADANATNEFEDENEDLQQQLLDEMLSAKMSAQPPMFVSGGLGADEQEDEDIEEKVRNKF